MEQPNKNKIMYFEFRKLVYSILSPACPQVFSSGGTCTLLPSLLGVHPNFWGCNVPSNSLHLGVQRKLTAFSPCKVVHHAVFCKYYAELAKTFFSVWHWVRQEAWFSLTHGLCVCRPFFCNIVYNLSIFFYTELNARLPIYSHDH
jgi:hypothetical protein